MHIILFNLRLVGHTVADFGNTKKKKKRDLLVM